MFRVQSFVVPVIVLAHFVNSLNAPRALSDESADEADDVVVVGDMEFSEKQYQFLFSNDTVKRHGLKRQFNHWPKGVVPVKLDKEFKEDYKKVILEALDYIQNVSCITFLLDFDEDEYLDYVKIIKATGCSSPVGCQRRGVQYVKLEQNACKRGNIIHEMLHTLGFLHMHTAAQRDDFVRINYNNIVPRARKNFEKYVTYVSMYDTQYDFRSIMHYSKNAFAADSSKRTITPFERVRAMGQRQVMTDGDITRLNRMYRCPDFLKEDEFVESDDEMFDNSEEVEFTELDSMEDSTDEEENDDEQDDGPTEDEINFYNSESFELADEVNETAPIVKFLKSLIKTNLKLILSYIGE